MLPEVTTPEQVPTPEQAPTSAQVPTPTLAVLSMEPVAMSVLWGLKDRHTISVWWPVQWCWEGGLWCLMGAGVVDEGAQAQGAWRIRRHMYGLGFG